MYPLRIRVIDFSLTILGNIIDTGFITSFNIIDSTMHSRRKPLTLCSNLLMRFNDKV